MRTSLRSTAARPLVALLALVVSAGCSGSSLGGGAAERSSTVKIGLLVSQSGVYKSVGDDMRNGFQLYLALNGGKLGGHPVEVVTADEGDGADTARPAAERLIKQDKVLALAGVVGAGSVAAVKPLLDANKVPLVGANGRPTKLADPAWVWHTSYISTEPGLVMGEYVHKAVDGPVYVIGPDYQGGWDEIGGFVEAYTKAGGKLANPDGKPVYTPFPGTKNFQPYLAAIAESGAKAVYTFYAGGAAVDFVKQYQQFGLAGKVPLYAAGFLTEGGVLTAQGDAAANIYNSLNYSPDLDNPANRTFTSEYQKKYGGQPTTFAMATYDAAAVLDKAIAAAGKDLTSQTLNAAIGKVGQINSPRGPWQFDAAGHTPVQKWYLRQVRKDGATLSNVLVQELATVGG
ncbi:ABC transporter substrate-binding protein [Longispora urticae]